MVMAVFFPVWLFSVKGARVGWRNVAPLERGHDCFVVSEHGLTDVSERGRRDRIATRIRGDRSKLKASQPGPESGWHALSMPGSSHI